MRRSLFVVAALSLPVVACGGAAATGPGVQAPPPPAPAPTLTPPPPAPLPVVAPQVSETPASCKAFLEVKPSVESKKACGDSKAALDVLATAASAELKGDTATRDAALRSLSDCERVPLLVADVVRAELAPMTCAEAILVPILEIHGKEGLPAHQAAARALVGASRLARLRPAKGTFDLLAKAEVDPAAKDAAIATLVAWRDAIEKQESDAIQLAKGAPAEIAVLVRFEIADAWLALAKEIRATPLPDEIKTLKAKDPDLPTTYLAKLNEQTAPLVDRAQQIALAGLGIAVRDGILVKNLPSFQPMLEFFRSTPGFEIRPTRVLDLAMPAEKLPPKATPATIVAAALPPWAVYASLERASPGELLSTAVVEAMAENRGIVSALRLELEKDKKLDDAHKSAVALARTRMALAYGSRPDAEAVVTWKKPKAPLDQLRIGVDLALLGPSSTKAKLGDPLVTKAQTGYDLAPLDGLAKGKGAIAAAAAFDAALLSLDAAQTFLPDGSDPSYGPAEQKKAYENAIARLDKVSTFAGMDPARSADAKKLADGARESLKLMEKPVKN